MVDRLTAWNFKGKKCPTCGFNAGLLYVHVCKMCSGSLLDCPKCKQLTCLGAKSWEKVQWQPDGKPYSGGIRI
jgi:hypothetical protein